MSLFSTRFCDKHEEFTRNYNNSDVIIDAYLRPGCEWAAFLMLNSTQFYETFLSDHLNQMFWQRFFLEKTLRTYSLLQKKFRTYSLLRKKFRTYSLFQKKIQNLLARVGASRLENTTGFTSLRYSVSLEHNRSALVRNHEMRADFQR